MNEELRPLIQVERLSKFFGETMAFEDVSFDVSAGTVFAIIGRSGDGKSTLLRCLVGLEERTSGAIWIDGRCIYAHDGTSLKARELARLRSKIGFVFQGYVLFPHLSVAENVGLALTRVQGLSWPDAFERSIQALGRVGLAHKALSLPTALSGGQQQRVAIARALVLEPLALLLDEPTSALDPESASDVLRLIEQLRDEGVTMVLVSHQMNLVRRIADELLFLQRGHIVVHGDASELLGEHGDPRVLAFASGVSQ